MTDVQKTVLNLSSAALFGKAVTVPAGTDWQAVYDEISRQNIVSLTYPVAERCDVPEEVLKEWSEERDRYILNNARIIGAHLGLHKMMSEAKISYVILKGVASGSYYPDYMSRAYGDVDFLVDRKDSLRASELFESLGFRKKKETPRHKEYNKHGIEYELHHVVSGLPAGSIRKSFDIFFSDIMESAELFCHGASFCNIPSDRHNAVILLTHTADHMIGYGLGVRHLIDWAVFADRMSDEFFAADMQSSLKQLGLWHYCCILTNLCTKYLGLRDCPWAGQTDQDYLNELMADFFSSGDFGRIYKANLDAIDGGVAPIDNLGRIGVIKSFLMLLNNRAKRLPVIGRFSVLLPLGWCFIIARYLIRMILRSRSSTMARNLIVHYGERRDLTQEWKLFKREES